MFGQFDIVSMLYRIPALLIGLSFHEAAHAYMAYRCGDPTARNMGRMSLDPLRHLDVTGTICLLLFGFGWAKPVPVNPRNFKNYRRDTIYVSLAGILTNLVVAFIFTGILYAISGAITNIIIFSLIQYIIFINIALAVFNLIPIPPLDGYRVLKSTVNGGYQFFSFVERYGSFLLIALLIFGTAGRIISAVVWAIFNLFGAFFALIF